MADKEIILSAGAIGSPQILMLSRIALKAELETLGITVLNDLPGVGKNLQDHFMAAVAYECTRPVTLAHATDAAQAAWLQKGMGLLTSNVGQANDYQWQHQLGINYVRRKSLIPDWEIVTVGSLT